VILSIVAVGSVALGAVGIGTWGVRFARTTSDLFVASRAISPWWNAAAISGEYLSAASFLGIAGLEMKFGASALWLPVGFTAGYLALLLFVAAPLRRFGAYTISDFAEARLASPRVRLLSAAIVVLIAGFYLVPQLKGAGLTVGQVTGAPYWVGVVVVAAIVAFTVGLGGMRGITYVQAFQFWVKVFAISVPAIVLLIHLGGLPAKAALFGRDLPRAPGTGLVVTIPSRARVTFPEATRYRIDGRPGSARAGQKRTLRPGRLELPPRAAVPVASGIDAQRGDQWSRPVSSSGRAQPLFVYSLLLATFLGTMGLPHILVRFYTNPDGSAARRTTVRVLGLLGLFYLFPAVYGLLGRVLVPALYVTGDTDSVVLRLPQAAWPGLGGDVLAAVVAAGAFAAFTSTASGLVVSIAGTLSYDVLGRVRAAAAPTPGDRRRRFRVAAPAGIAVPCAIALFARHTDISVLVGWAFALAASTFCPLLLLGIWWTRLTARGAAVGMVAGATTASAAIAVAIATQPSSDTVAGALLTQPAIITVPIAFTTMIVLSLTGREAPPAETAMLALHSPDGLGVEALARSG
jgi:Na+(H+)/acetate symporter ActP